MCDATVFILDPPSLPDVRNLHCLGTVVIHTVILPSRYKNCHVPINPTTMIKSVHVCNLCHHPIMHHHYRDTNCCETRSLRCRVCFNNCCARGKDCVKRWHLLP